MKDCKIQAVCKTFNIFEAYAVQYMNAECVDCQTFLTANDEYMVQWRATQFLWGHIDDKSLMMQLMTREMLAFHVSGLHSMPQTLVTTLVVTMVITRPRLARASPGLFLLKRSFSVRHPNLAVLPFCSRGGRGRAEDDDSDG